MKNEPKKQFEEYEELEEYTDDDELNFIDIAEDEKEEKENEEMEDSFEESVEPVKKSGVKIVQAVIGIVMLLGILAAVFMIIRWQRGKDLVINRDELSEDYSTEKMDYVEYFDPTSVEGYFYDGTWDILILGDQMLYGEDEENGVAGQIRKNTGANVTALSLPDASISMKNANYSLDDPEDAFSLYCLILCMTATETPDYALQTGALSYMKDAAIYKDYIEKLAAIDMNSIDTIILSCGLYDYLEEHPTIVGGYKADNPYGEPSGVDGALYEVINMLRSRYPDKQIIVSSPTFCLVKDKDGSLIGADLYMTKDGSLGDYVGGMATVTAALNTSFVDNYFGAGFTCDNYDAFLTEDGQSLTQKGAKAVADHIGSFLYDPNYAK